MNQLLTSYHTALQYSMCAKFVRKKRPHPWQSVALNNSEANTVTFLHSADNTLGIVANQRSRCFWGASVWSIQVGF